MINQTQTHFRFVINWIGIDENHVSTLHFGMYDTHINEYELGPDLRVEHDDIMRPHFLCYSYTGCFFILCPIQFSLTLSF